MEPFRYSLWWTGRRLITSDDMSKAIKMTTTTIFGYSFGVLTWRHLAKVFQQAEIAAAQDSRLINHLFDIQSGHTTYTAQRHYSINAEPMEEVDYATIIKFIILSVAQQKVNRSFKTCDAGRALAPRERDLRRDVVTPPHFTGTIPLTYHVSPTATPNRPRPGARVDVRQPDPRNPEQRRASSK